MITRVASVVVKNANDDSQANSFSSTIMMDIVYWQTVDSKRAASAGKRRKFLITFAVYRSLGVL